MEERAHVNELPDDVLIRILWHPSNNVVPCTHEDTLRWEADSVFRNRLAHILFPRGETPVPTPPSCFNAGINLRVAAVCRRWRRLAQRHVSTLLVAENRAVSLQDLSHAVACFANLTHLHLCDNSVATIDEAFLSDLASSCPNLIALHVGHRILPEPVLTSFHNLDDARFSHLFVDRATKYDKRKELHPITEPGLDRFFRECSQLQQLSLYCLHTDVKLPPSFFTLLHLRTLVLTDASALADPRFLNLASLTTLRIASRKLHYEQLSSLCHLPNLTSVSVSSGTCLIPSGQPSPALTLPPFLKSLQIQTYCPHSELLFPSGASYPCLERLLVLKWGPLAWLSDTIGQRLGRLRELTFVRCDSLTSLPETFTSLCCLTSLTVSICSQLANLPGNFGNLPSLTNLVLDYSPISGLPASFSQLTTLRSLSISGCGGIRQLPAGFCSMTGLKSLRLLVAPRLVLPEEIGGLSSLECFILNANRTQQQLPPSFTQLTSLLRLELEDCVIAALPEDFGQLSSLREIYVESCPILEIPEAVTVLTSLEALSIHFCEHLSSIPRSLDCLQRLKLLEIRGCLLLSEPPGSLPLALEVLKLRYSSQDVPLPNIASLRNLRELRLGQLGPRQRVVLGSCLSHLTRLSLALVDDSEEFPVCWDSCAQLRTLTISFAGKVARLPSDIGLFPKLRRLEIFRAEELLELPATISGLCCLTSLEVHAPKLAALPESIGVLSRLRELDVSDCAAMERLPASLTQLACLNTLNASRSGLRLLPANFARLAQLKRLYLGGCENLEALPEDLPELGALQLLNVNSCKNVTRSSNMQEQATVNTRINDMYGLHLCAW